MPALDAGKSPGRKGVWPEFLSYGSTKEKGWALPSRTPISITWKDAKQFRKEKSLQNRWKGKYSVTSYPASGQSMLITPPMLVSPNEQEMKIFQSTGGKTRSSAHGSDVYWPYSHYLVVDTWNFYVSDPRNIAKSDGTASAPPTPDVWRKIQQHGAYFISTWLQRVQNGTISQTTGRGRTIFQKGSIRSSNEGSATSTHPFITSSNTFRSFSSSTPAAASSWMLDTPRAPKIRSTRGFTRELWITGTQELWITGIQLPFLQIQRMYYNQPLMYQNAWMNEMRQYLTAMACLLCQDKKY